MAAAQPMSVDEREAKEAEEFRTGPLSVLTTSVKTNSQVSNFSMLRSLQHCSAISSSCAREKQQQQQEQ